MKDLHENQKHLIRILSENIGEPITMKELADRIGVASTSVVHHHITQLEKRGFLKRDPNNPSNYQVMSGEPEKQIAYLNLYGMAQCGPDGTILGGNPEARIPVSTSLLSFPSREAFLVKANGDSMAPRINSGDYVIARVSHEPINGQIVVCVNEEIALIKRLSVGKDDKGQQTIWLTSINPEYEPIQAKPGFKIEGVVKGLAFRSFH